MRYQGISYPGIFQNKPAQWIWKRLFCPLGFHLFDEVISTEHSLYCDACHLDVIISRIEP